MLICVNLLLSSENICMSVCHSVGSVPPKRDKIKTHLKGKRPCVYLLCRTVGRGETEVRRSEISE